MSAIDRIRNATAEDMERPLEEVLGTAAGGIEWNATHLRVGDELLLLSDVREAIDAAGLIQPGRTVEIRDL